ncbi:RFC checkpoint protein Rad17 [Sporothrix eucalyptigena]|uniref:RFC checkpoint protein Rad17 n=1 Tax=Sporothrix eucalyptigena TaxID=1812306 RepID=A0ABP0BSS6_9PEZI
MSIQSEPKTSRTLWPRTFVYTCDHFTTRYISVKEALPRATNAATAPATRKVPFLMPVRIDRECITCIRQKMLARLEDKAKAVRTGFTSLLQGIDSIVKNKKVTQEGEDSQIEKDESWDDEPVSLDRLLPIINCDDEESDVRISLSEQIRKIREDLLQRKLAWMEAKTHKAGDDNEDEVYEKIDYEWQNCSPASDNDVSDNPILNACYDQPFDSTNYTFFEKV